MQSIIPSLSEFQHELNLHITQFCQSLQKKGYADTEIDALRRLICFVVDNKATSYLSAQGMSWQQYAMGKLFYKTDLTSLVTVQHTQLLLKTKREELVHYTLQLITLSPRAVPGSDIIQKIQLPYITSAPQTIVIPEPTDSVFTDEHKVSMINSNHTSWTSLFVQLFLAVLLLSTIWSGCLHFLAGGR
ncbi:hypothetical protein ACGVWS_10085 [Enterobacteriaceae bacterium LUAb1]